MVAGFDGSSRTALVVWGGAYIHTHTRTHRPRSVNWTDRVVSREKQIFFSCTMILFSISRFFILHTHPGRTWNVMASCYLASWLVGSVMRLLVPFVSVTLYLRPCDKISMHVST